VATRPPNENNSCWSTRSSKKSYNDYLGANEAEKELILYPVRDKALAPLKKLYIGFGDTTVLRMIDHCCLKTEIKMTTAQKHEYRTMGYNNPWDPTTSITAYFTQLDRFQMSLGDRRIVTSEEEKMMAAGVQMWNSNMFTEDQMVAWENRTPVQQRGQHYRRTSPTSGWNANNIPQ
jgi:hypothetical protein